MTLLAQVWCPLCGAHNGFAQVYRDNPSRVVRCRNCDLVFFNPQPSIEYLKKFYSSQSGYLSCIEENLRSFEQDPLAWKKTADFILNKVTPYLPPTNKDRILDVGCAYGFFLLFARERGLDTYGIEISTETSAYAKKQGIEILNTTLLDSEFDDNFFSAITMNNVLEHTLNPVAELGEAYRILTNQGVIFVAVPNFDSLVAKADSYYWKMKSWPNHLFYFTEFTLAAMVRKVGFKVLEVFTHQGESDYADDVRVVRDRLFLTDDEEAHQVIRLLWKLKKGQELVVLARKH